MEGVEICDDGNTDDADGCTVNCTPGECADGVVQAGEQCDDGNVGRLDDEDFCHNDCTSEGYDDDFESNTLMQLPWVTSGNADWLTANIMPHEGLYVARSGTIGHTQATSLELGAYAPSSGFVRFWYRTSSENNYDYLRLYIDNVQQGQWSGNQPWAQAEVAVTDGQHVFRWSYTKDGSVNSFEDTVYLDEVYIGL